MLQATPSDFQNLKSPQCARKAEEGAQDERRERRKRSAAATAAFKRLHCARLCSSRMDG